MTKKISILIILNLFLATAAFAQFPREFFSNSMPVIVNGPTNQSQTAQLLTDNGVFTPTGIFVTASFSNQQYSGLNTTPDNAVLMFGATNNPGGAFPFSRPVFTPMTEIGAASDGMFSSSIDGTNTGIDVATNYSFNIFTSVQHWAGLPAGANGVPTTNSKVYIGDLTFTFSSPVTGAYMHLVALGGFHGNLGFATELELVTPGVTMESVTGNSSFVVTPTQVLNGNAVIGDLCSDNSAACGTLRLGGFSTDSVTFKVYIRGDGRNPQAWAVPGSHSGDQWLVGFSLPGTLTTSAPVTISGRALEESGRGISAAKISLVDSSGQTRTATTNRLGYYSFEDLEAGETVILSISHKRYRFERSMQIHTPTESLSEINFIGLY